MKLRDEEKGKNFEIGDNEIYQWDNHLKNSLAFKILSSRFYQWKDFQSNDTTNMECGGCEDQKCRKNVFVCRFRSS